MRRRHLLLCVLVVLGVRAHAQPLGGVDAGSLSGRDFAGLRLPLAPVDGPVVMRAARARVWNEGSVQRILLSGDVELTLGPSSFSAARAVLWLERLEEDDQKAEGSLYQVFAYLDRAANPTGRSGVGVWADRLPVRGVVRLDRPAELRADLFLTGRSEDQLVLQGERTLGRWLGQIAAGDKQAAPAPAAIAPPSGPPAARVDPATARSARAPYDLGEAMAVEQITAAGPLATPENSPIFARDGIVTLSTGKVTILTPPQEEKKGEEDRGVVIASEGVILQYSDAAGEHSLQISAQRAVVFLKDAAPADPTSLQTGSIGGIYLEGDVIATDGRYTLRGPQIYYDLARDRALIPEAVFWTYDAQRRLPLYVRAKAMRQESAQEFTAEQPRLAASALLDPFFSLGASSVTISRRTREVITPETSEEASLRSGIELAGGGNPDELPDQRVSFVQTTDLDARGVTLRAGGVPVLYWPGVSGDSDLAVIRDVRVESSNDQGLAFKLRLDAYGLLGVERPPGSKGDLMIHEYTERGPALGGDWSWTDGPDEQGRLFAYGLLDDRGEDLMKPGTKLDRDGGGRGMITGEQAWNLDSGWRLWAEGAYIGDPAFIDAFFEEQAENRREFTTQGVLSKASGNTFASFQARANLNDFLANEYLLQSQGYSVDKLPELRYARLADELLAGSIFGPIRAHSLVSLSRMGLNLDETTAAERGLTTNFLSQRALGIAPGQSLAQRLRALGYGEKDVTRFDVREEFTGSLDAGPVHIVPFTVGRLTAYDTDFSGFSPQEPDNARLWGSVGVTAGTSVQRVNDAARSRLFDINRIRHIVEPSVTLWHAGSTVDRVDLPVYDQNVEGLVEGSMARMGVAQTWQTQRGEGGRWHSVDFLRLNSDLVFSSRDADERSPIGRFFESRPEQSNPGDFFVNDLLWQTSDALAFTAGHNWDMRRSQTSRTNVGAIVQHAPYFASSLELRYLNAQESTLLDLTTQYQLTSTYSLAGGVTYDFQSNDISSIGGELRRTFPSLILGANAAYNNITGETSFGFLVRPVGPRSSVTRPLPLDDSPPPEDGDEPIGISRTADPLEL